MSALKLIVLLGLFAAISATDKTKDALRRYYFKRNSKGCSPGELAYLAKTGVDVEKSNLDCTHLFSSRRSLGETPLAAAKRAALRRDKLAFYNEFFKRDEALAGGCSPAEIALLESWGINVSLSPGVDCSRKREIENSVSETEKRSDSCEYVYSVTPACCSNDCDWMLLLYCMNPSQMICDK